MEFIKKYYHYLLFISAVFFLGNPSKFPADDGFFYPQIAYNIVGKGFMGFNDLYLTNGFHPLWMVFCVLAELFNPFDKIFVLNIIWLFQVLLILFGFILLDKTIFKDYKTGKFLSMAFYCFMFFSLGTLFLTEAHLAFFTISLLIYFVFRKIKNDFVFGLICSLVFLARLDHIFIVIAFGFLYWSFRQFSIKSILFMLVGFSVLSVPYLVANSYIFDYPVPISGRIKSTFPNIQPYINFELLYKFFTFCGILYFALLIFTKNIPYKSVKFTFLIGSMLHLVYNLLFQSAIGQWYFVSQMFMCGLLIYDLTSSLRLKFFEINLVGKLMFFCTLLFVCTVGWLKLTTSFSILNNIVTSNSKLEQKSDDLVQQTALAFENEIPKQSRIFVYDFPGKFAFYSDFNVIPADGLVGNMSYFKAMRSGNFRTFLKTNKIDYLVLPTDFQLKDKNHVFLAIHVNNTGEKNVFSIRNTLYRKTIDSIQEDEMNKIKSYPNPLKTWQSNYDSITVYTLKN